MNLLVLNGPNIARLGVWAPACTGPRRGSNCGRRSSTTRRAASKADVRQTDSEAELIGWLHEAADAEVPVILNPAAFTHYSYGVRDAAAQLSAPLIEVHISNPAAREEFRHTSVIAGVATGTIAGFGVTSYLLAVDAVVALGAR